MQNYVLGLAIPKQIRLLILMKDANGVQIQEIYKNKEFAMFQPKRKHDWLADLYADYTDAKYFSLNNDINFL